jgi:hypothetical protein
MPAAWIEVCLIRCSAAIPPYSASARRPSSVIVVLEVTDDKSLPWQERKVPQIATARMVVS